MNDNHSHLDESDHLENILPVCPDPGKVLGFKLSPLGWGINVRLVVVAVASALLWLAVAWALGWLS